MTLTEQSERAEEYAAQLRKACETLDRNTLSATERAEVAGNALCEAVCMGRLAEKLEHRLRAIANNAAEPDGPRIVRADFGARPRPVDGGLNGGDAA